MRRVFFTSRESTVRSQTAAKQEDPLEKEGVVGSFCRAYPIEEAIDRFLGDGSVFLRGHIAGQRDHDAHSGSLRGVAVGGVEAGCVLALFREPLDEIGVGVIHILSCGCSATIFPKA